jgi:molybdate transport system ATP-binding protein
VIEVEVEKRFGAFHLAARFAAPGIGVTALFGRSGVGKTMIVNMIAGLVTPDRGQIVLQGDVLFSSEHGIDLPPDRRRVGYVFQEGRLFPHYTVRGNLRYGMRRRGEPQAIAFQAVVDLLGLAHLLDRPPADLSGGEKQRVAIGRALLSSPRLLLMDEPLASLDAPRKAEIMPFVERLRDELRIPIIYVSHVMEEIVRLADTLVLLAEGQVAAIGTVEDLTSRLDLRPLTGRYDAGAVIAAVVAAHDEVSGLTNLAFPGGSLRVARLSLPLGASVRARIRARDVAVAVTRPTGLSIRNIVAARIVEIAADRGPVVDIRLDIGTPEQPVALWSRVTASAAQELGLAIGREVYALIKTVALDRATYGRDHPHVGEIDEDDPT